MPTSMMWLLGGLLVFLLAMLFYWLSVIKNNQNRNKK
jgi:hypothetical protein